MKISIIQVTGLHVDGKGFDTSVDIKAEILTVSKILRGVEIIFTTLKFDDVSSLHSRYPGFDSLVHQVVEISEDKTTGRICLTTFTQLGLGWHLIAGPLKS